MFFRETPSNECRASPSFCDRLGWGPHNRTRARRLATRCTPRLMPGSRHCQLGFDPWGSSHLMTALCPGGTECKSDYKWKVTKLSRATPTASRESSQWCGDSMGYRQRLDCSHKHSPAPREPHMQLCRGAGRDRSLFTALYISI
jgi:hypothetical protein